MIGHQVFDLKLTSRVKMSMVGVPEATIDYWTAKFLAQGFKVRSSRHRGFIFVWLLRAE